MKTASMLMWGLVLVATASAGTLSYADAQRLSAGGVSASELDVAVSEQRVRYLEAQSRPHLDFRPQLLLISVVNPGGAGATLLLDSLFGSRSNTAQLALRSARLDLLETRLARVRAKFHAEIEVNRLYRNALHGQLVADQACRSADRVGNTLNLLHERVNAGSATALDVTRVDVQLVDWESGCSRARADFDQALLELGNLLDISLERVELPAEPTPAEKVPGSPDELVAAMAARYPELNRLAQELERGRPTTGGRHLVSASYYHHVPASLSIGGGTQKRVEERFLELRAEQIGLSIQKLKREMDLEVQRLSSVYHAGARRMVLMAEKIQTINRQQNIAAERLRAGVGDVLSLFAAESAAAEAEIESAGLRADIAGEWLALNALGASEGKLQSSESSLAAETTDAP